MHQLQQMYLKNIVIKNFRAIENMELEFQPGVNLLIGDNGVGKTSVLDAISVALAGYLSGISGVAAKNILKDDIRISLQEIGEASTGEEYKIPVEVGCTVNINEDNIYEWTRSRKDEDSSSKTKIDNKAICNLAREMTNDMECLLPLLSFQSEARVWQVKRGDFGKELKKN